MLDEAKERKEQAERNKQTASGGVAMSGGGGVMASGAMNPLNPQLAALNKDHLQAGFLNSHSPHSMHSVHGPSSDNSGKNTGAISESSLIPHFSERFLYRRRKTEWREEELRCRALDIDC